MKKFFRSINNALIQTAVKTRCFIQDCRGDLATNTIGGIIVAVVIIGLLIAAVNAFFPSFFSGMFKTLKTKLNAMW